MSNVPCTLIVKSMNLERLPTEMLYVICREVFRYGVRLIKKRGGQVVVHLTYSPKTETLMHKFGNLPVNYIRLASESEEHIETFAIALRRFNFNASTIDDSQMIESPASPTPALQPAAAPQKRKLAEEEEEKQEENEEAKRQRYEEREILEVYDDDAGDFNSQKVSYILK